MSKKSELHPHFVMLEISDQATFQEVKASYLHLKNLYSSNSRIFTSFPQTANQMQKSQFLEKIDLSYQVLKQYYEAEEKKKEQEKIKRVAENKIPEFEAYTGDSLRLTREVLGIELEEVANSSGIAIGHLRNIETEQYAFLPPKAYVKAFIRKYAEFLSLDPVKVSADYIRRMEKQLTGDSE